MGQYHKFMNFDKKEILNPPGLLKLMEWSYQQNEYMLQIENLLKTSWKGDRVLVIGDYADDFYEGEYSSELLKTIREENKEYGLHNIYDYPYKELKNTSFYSNRLPSRYIYNDSIKEYIDLKDKRITNYDLDRKLTEAYNIILEVKNDHEELNTKEFNKDLKEIDKINETLTSCKTYFNNNTSELNKLIRKVPTNVVAKIHGYKIKPFFDGKNMQDAVIDDFKL